MRYFHFALVFRAYYFAAHYAVFMLIYSPLNAAGANFAASLRSFMGMPSYVGAEADELLFHLRHFHARLSPTGRAHYALY